MPEGISADLLKRYGLCLHGDPADLIAEVFQFLFIAQEGMVDGDTGNRFDFLKRELKCVGSVFADVFPKRGIFAHKTSVFNRKKKTPCGVLRAPGRTRTGTASLPGDFESPTSTNSITGAEKTTTLF